MHWLISLCFAFFIIVAPVHAENFSANFQGVDIHEFINTVSKNLGKTIILDDAVKGKVTIRSYEKLNQKQYYQFFLNVLDVYGYAVISMPNNILKVIPAKAGKRAALTSLNAPAEGDELIMRIFPLRNIAAKDIAPLLRQLNDSIGVGNVAYYESGNALLMTGRAEVVNGLIELAREMDRKEQANVDTIALQHASAPEVVKIINSLFHEEGQAKGATNTGLKIVADERTNSVLVGGDETAQNNVRSLIYQLDQEQIAPGNTKVIHLKYAKAQSLVEVLSGISANLQNGDKQPSAAISVMKNVVIKADEHTNSLIINASLDLMRELEKVIEQLDVRRAQVLVEAIIVEMQDADGLNFGIQWANKSAGGTQFSNAQTPIAPGFEGGMSEVFKNANGLVAGFYSGNWAGLLTAISSSSKNNILATPSIVTLDNENAEFSVGQDVPVLSGSQTTNSDNIFNTVSRKTVGIKLKVKPQINKGQTVLLQVEQEVSSVAENSSLDNEKLGATFNVRTVNNAVLVESGNTVVVGGLLDKSQIEVDNGVPYLSRIPILGALFRSNTHKNNKRNLILFLRPTIIRSEQGYSLESARKTENFQTEQNSNQRLEKAIEHALPQSQHNNGAFLRAKHQLSAFYAKEAQ